MAEDPSKRNAQDTTKKDADIDEWTLVLSTTNKELLKDSRARFTPPPIEKIIPPSLMTWPKMGR